jgi:type VI secretion system protein ImpC
VLGDLSGRGERGAPPATPLASRRLHAVDLDNFDSVLRGIGPVAQVALPGAGAPRVAIDFQALDDFHPDALYRRLDLFATIRDLRERLHDPARFESAARELLASAASLEPAADRAPAEPAGESAVDLTKRLLGARPGARDPEPQVDAVIRRLIAPHIVTDPTADAPPYLAVLDNIATESLRALLAAPGCKRLEASWRSLRALVDQLDLDESTALLVLDVSAEELRSDLLAPDRALGETDLLRCLSAHFEHEPPACIVFDHPIAASAADLRLLATLGTVGSHLGAPVIAAAPSALLGTSSLAQHPDPHDWRELEPDLGTVWGALRGSPVAAWIGLALPRILLRLPYGPQADEIEAFGFEELADADAHEAYLWGNPAYACALLLGQAHAEAGWDMAPGDIAELTDLPACVVRAAGESRLLPCAEVNLGERAVERILASGLMAFVSDRDRNACRLARFQSIASPVRALEGAWTG